MLFDLPLQIDDDFISSVLQAEKEKIYSIFFTLPSPFMNDARVIYSNPTFEQVHTSLKRVPDSIKKYTTLNGRYNPPANYETNNAKVVANRLISLHDEGLLDGIIFLDFFYIKRLVSLEPRIRELELVPSINYTTDTVAKFHTLRRYLEDTCGCYKAEKVIIDRSLNRDKEGFTKMVEGIKRYNEKLKIEVLVNEGCMLHCPFKINHDIFISMSNDHSTENKLHTDTNCNDFNLNKLYGCQNSNLAKPINIFRSPFIRPEDLHNFENLADVAKIAGKTVPPSRAKRTIQAYFKGKYSGNLLDLLDATQIVSKNVFIPNDKLPDNFFEILSTCDKNCSDCQKCETLFSKYIEVFT